MTRESEPASVRDARMAAKKMSRQGAMTHQQALDAVARERGHRNWAALLKSEWPEREPLDGRRMRNERHAIDQAEAMILEDAASTRRWLPWMPPVLVPAANATLSALAVGLLMVGVQGLAYAAAAGAAVLCAAASAKVSRDGMPRTRRVIAEWVSPAWMVAVGVAVLILMLAIVRHGLGALTSGDLPQAMDTDWPSTLITVAFAGYSASTGAHRAMALARPETVRPERTGDLHVPASPATGSPAVARVMRVATYGGIGLAFVGLGCMLWTTVAVVLYHIGIDPAATGVDSRPVAVGLGLILVGTIVACASSFGANIDQPIPARIVEDASRRAARARRFLMAGKRNVD